MRRRTPTDTREALLDAGLHAFLEHGYHGTGIKSVLDRVGVPKGSFYNYFESKEAFGAATIAYFADCMGKKMATAMDGAPNALEGLRRFFTEEMRGFEATGFVGGCLVANLGGELEGSDVFRDALGGAMGRYVEGVSAAIARAQSEGVVRSDLSAASLGRLLVDAWEGAVIRMKIERSLAPLEHCLSSLLDGFFRPQ